MQDLASALDALDLSGIPDEPEVIEVSEVIEAAGSAADDMFTLSGDVEAESMDLPEDADPAIVAALNDLDKARSHLLRGQYRAMISYSGDALNRVAAAQDLNGYATY